MIFCLNEKESLNHQKFVKSVIFALINASLEDGNGFSLFENIFQKQSLSQTKSEQIHISQENKMKELRQKKLPNSLSDLSIYHNFFNDLNSKNFEDLIEICCNTASMIRQIVKNLTGIYKGNISVLIELILEEDYIKKLFIFLALNMESNRDADLKNQLSDQILQIIYQIMTIYHELEGGSFHGSNQKISLKKVEEEGSSDSEEVPDDLMNKLRGLSLIIIQQAAYYFYDFMKFSKNDRIIKQQSSGSVVEQITFVRYWKLQIILTILETIEKNRYRPVVLSKLKQGISSIIPLIEQCLKINRWNNIVQKLLTKIVRMYLTICYEQFYEQHIAIEKVSTGFLGFLIEYFRNQYFVFLSSMKMSFQGDRHAIYLMSKSIAGELQKNSDLSTVFNKLEEWRKFLHEDLKKYERTCENSSYFDETMIEPEISKTKSNVESGIVFAQPLESIQQILENFENNKRWSIKKLKRARRKQSLSTHQVIQQIDSLQNFQLSLHSHQHPQSDSIHIPSISELSQ